MKTIKIAHLYYDLMNLYGESGNVLALVSAFKKQGIKCEVDKITKGDKIDFSKYDIYYMGTGTEDNQEIVRKDILRYKEEISKTVKKKTFIMTGNAYELFGKSIDDNEALGIYNFKSKKVRNRIVGEQFMKTYFLESTIIGFQNRGSVNDNKENYLFKVIKGNGNSKDVLNEGYHIDNFYGTYNIGPLLIRNPELTDKIVEDIMNNYKYPYEKITTTTDYLAHDEYLKNFPIDINTN